MKNLKRLREKYWSETNSLYPHKNSRCEHLYHFVGVNAHALIAAQDDARDAMEAYQEGKTARAITLWNRATHHLTAAYDGGTSNDAFWRQFI